MTVLRIYTITIALGAALLFLAQPMFAKMLLPSLGGTPAVWSTCVAFSQAVLLLGYAYAHLGTRRLGPRRHAPIHIALLALPALTLPFGVGATAPPSTEGVAAVSWLLGVLGIGLGPALLAVATTNPLLQRWYSTTGAPGAADPYFLSVASNAGSLAALVGYPLVVEPQIGLRNQAIGWAVGYGIWGVMVLACAIALRRSAAGGELETRPEPLGWRRPLRWMALAAVPSSLMLGVTTMITTDIASTPLLWAVPLGLYLITYIIVFARRPIVPPGVAAVLGPAAALLSLALLATGPTIRMALMVAHLIAFALVALALHSELARDRPKPGHLTAFYLAMAAGGVIGGGINAWVAPLIFSDVWEYPLMLALACALLPGRRDRGGRAADVIIPAILGMATAWLSGPVLQELERISWQRFGHSLAGGRVGMVVGCAGLAWILGWGRPNRQALGALAVWLGASSTDWMGSRTLLEARSLFGVHRVVVDPEEKFVYLMHGTTIHGSQPYARDRRGMPTSYFHRNGPIGDLFGAWSNSRAKPVRRVAVLGLGAGTLASYGAEGRAFTFYEIDPLVRRIAEDPRFVTYLSDAPGERPTVVMGDGRLGLAKAPDGWYDLIFFDAFSSDAIPVHLITVEAMAAYRDKLAPGGLLVFNVTNRHLDLRAVIAGGAKALGMVARVRADDEISDADWEEGRLSADFAVMARSEADLGPLATIKSWRDPAEAGPPVLWTDDRSSLFDVLKFRGH